MVTVGNPVSRTAVEMWVMHVDLRKISVSGDWMYLDESDITQQFEILREGILRDVFLQRASSAWQGMQPQRLTVSLLLPCMGSKADEWVDFMQCQRQFWPTMTTRHASLAPIELLTFRRERRLMISCFWGCGFVCGFVFVLFFVLFGCCLVFPSRLRSFELYANSMRA